MSNRDFSKELSYNYYRDYENGENTETIEYQYLFDVLQELCDRIEKLEQRLDRDDEYQQEQIEQ